MKKIIIYLILIVHCSFFTVLCSAQVPELWGTSRTGGIYSYGTIFKINGDGTGFSNPYNFNNTKGAGPIGKLSLYNNNGIVYGVAGGSTYGDGVIFSFDTLTNVFTNIHDFNDTLGLGPSGTLFLANDNKFYGTTYGGGLNSQNYGVLYSFDPSTNIYTVFHNFPYIGFGPQVRSILIQAANGLLYGSTYAGGLNNKGVIFTFNPITSTYNEVYNFDSLTLPFNNSYFFIQATNGKLYGLAGVGNNNAGNIFSFDPISNTYQNLYNFNGGTLGNHPTDGLIQASNGLLYGMTEGGGMNNDGVIFSFDIITNIYTVLYNFNGTTGKNPQVALIQASDGKLYGVTVGGGLNNDGVVFRYNLITNTYIDIHDFDATDGDSPLSELLEFTCPLNTLSINNNHQNICAGDSVTLMVNGANNYMWNPLNTSDSIVRVSPSATTMYLVTGYKGNCVKVDTIIVTVNQFPSVSITTNGPTTFCGSSSINLDAGSFSFFNWSNGSTDETISVNSTNTYAVTVTDYNGCTGTASQAVSVFPNPTPSITGGTSLCTGDTLILGAGTYSQYHWSTGFGTPFITVSASGTYIVTVTDSNGCTGTASQAVAVSPSPTPTIIPNGPTTFCQGGSVSLDAGIYSSYLWNNSMTTQSINATTSGDYSITVTNSSGCTGTASETVTVIANPVPHISPPSPINLCEGESILLEASNGILYNWSTGATTQSLTISQSGSYIVTVTYGANCSNTSSPTDVIVHPIPTATITPTPDNVSFCEGDSINLITNSTTAPITYLWNTTATTQSIEATTGSTFIVTITDTNGCHSTSSITLTSYLYPVANFTYSMLLNTATFTNTSLNGMEYQWYFGDGNVSILMNPVHTYSHDSTYTITLIVTNPCGTDTIRETMTLTGIHSIGTNDNFLIYPNPANSSIFIHSPMSIINYQLSIESVLGQEIYNQTLSGIDNTIDISKWSEGLFFYEIIMDNEILRGKFVVQK